MKKEYDWEDKGNEQKTCLCKVCRVNMVCLLSDFDWIVEKN